MGVAKAVCHTKAMQLPRAVTCVTAGRAADLIKEGEAA